jgi:hypothetical protein
VSAAAGSSSSDGGSVESPFKRAHLWSYLPMSTWYVCGAKFRDMSFLLRAFWISSFEGSIGLNDKSHTLLVLVVHQQWTVAVALATEVPGIGGAPQGVVGNEMFGASAFSSAALGGAASAPGSSGAMSSESPGSYLPSSSDSVSPLVNWRWVESDAELACSQVATVERLLQDTGLDPP